MAKEPRNKSGDTQRGDRQRAEQGRQRLLMFGGVAFVALFLGAYALWRAPQEGTLNVARVNDDPALGPKTAPVTIVEYGDFGCAACKAWHRADILNQLRTAYGDKVRFEYRDFPVITPQSPKAAEAGQCAHDQGKFWEYHDLVFSASGIGVSQLKTYAGEVGLDVAEFSQCLDSGRHGPTVERDLQDAIERGFRGTPAFLINDEPVPLGGAPTFEYFQRVINEILATGR